MSETRAASVILSMILGLPVVCRIGPVCAQGASPAENSDLSQHDAQQIEMIIVTARKHAEAMQSVPISITALSGEDLQERGVKTLADIGRYTPNLIFDVGQDIAGGSASASVYIRGIGQNESSPTADPGVGIYVDGVYLARSVGSLLDVLDIERVEVLRGPQGTLFGKNTIGGAVSLISSMPSGEWGGYAEAGVGRFAERDVRGTMEFPIADQIAAKLSFGSRRRDGYAHSAITGEEFGSADHLTGRAVIRWTPTDSLALTTIADFSRQRDGGLFVRPVAPFNSPAPATIGLLNDLVYSRAPYDSGYDSRWLPATTYTNSATFPAASDLDQWGIAATLNWQLLPSLELTSVTSFRRLDTHVAVDSDASPLPVVQIATFDEQKQVSQELRLHGVHFDERLAWTAGLYYFEEDIHEKALLDAFHGLYPAIPDPRLDFNVLQFFDPHNTAYAAFGQATLRLNPQWSVTAGARYNYEEKTITASGTRLVSGAVFLPSLRQDLSWESWTPKLSIDYQITHDALAYASLSQGFKSGGVNYQVSNPADFAAYDPEQATTYELGFKSDWWNHRLRINGALFDTRYTDMQLRYRAGPGQFTCPTTASFCSFVVNAAEVNVQGGELEIAARPAAGLQIQVGLGNTRERFTRIDPLLLAGNVVNRDTRLPRTPEWTYSFGAEYEIPVANRGMLAMRADYSYSSDKFMEISNSPRLHQPGCGLLGARIAFTSADSRWELALSGQNLTNEIYITSGSVTYFTTGADGASFAIPRTWTASLRYNFGQ